VVPRRTEVTQALSGLEVVGASLFGDFIVENLKCYNRLGNFECTYYFLLRSTPHY
jgi:hypothetical protein